MPSQPHRPYHLPLHWGERLHAIGSNTQYLDVLAKNAGLSFNFDAPGSNTLDSHRLLLFAEEMDKQRQMGETEVKQKCPEENPLVNPGELKCAEGSTKPIKDSFALALRLNLANKYFTQGKRLADHDVLLSAVNEAMAAEYVEQAKSMLLSDTYKSEVMKSADSLTRSGIHSIPVFFFVSGDFEARVHGSSNQKEFLNVFKAAEDYWQEKMSRDP